MIHPVTAARRDAFLAGIAERPAIMGILNVTPDSFSDGGRFNGHDAAMAQARAMAAAGAAILDIGGESTRPGFTPVSAADEMARILPVITSVIAELDVPVSVDTRKASVARAALKLGAAVVNDIWGLQGDPAMADVVAEGGGAVVIMHNRATIDPAIDIFEDMTCFFARSLKIAEKAGIPRGRILIDPGIGFGKTLEQNLAVIADLDRLKRLGAPVLLGLSRKSFIGKVLGHEVGDRLIGTLTANIVGLRHGARVIRVHDVAEHADALALLQALGARP